MALTHHTGIPRPLNAGCSPRVIISVSNNPFCLGSSVTFTPTITCLETANIASYAWIVNGNIVSTSGDPYTTTELTNNDSVYFIVGVGSTYYYSNVIYMIVTSEGCITDIKYGLLYNAFCVLDIRQITSSDTYTVPTKAQWDTLVTYLGGSTVAGGKMKEPNLAYWGSILGDGSSGFNARGNGYRSNTGFLFYKTQFSGRSTTVGTSTTTRCTFIGNNSLTINTNDNTPNIGGVGIRLMRTATAEEQLLADGTACAPYTGNDGKNYRTVKIGTQVWLADNLAETKFRNGDYLHGYEGGSYQAISNAAWSALVSEGVCVYEDNLAYL